MHKSAENLLLSRTRICSSSLNSFPSETESKHNFFFFLFNKYCRRIVCDLWMKEWRARQKNKGGNQREAAAMMMGLYDVKVLMGISAAGL